VDVDRGGTGGRRGGRHTERRWLVYADKSVTRVDLATGQSKQFDLPGTLLDS